MDPKRKGSGLEEPETLELTLTQDIELPFDDEDAETADESLQDESFHQEDFETL